MTTGGWVFMFTSLGIVWGLCIWCFRRLLAQPDSPPADSSRTSSDEPSHD